MRKLPAFRKQSSRGIKLDQPPRAIRSSPINLAAEATLLSMHYGKYSRHSVGVRPPERQVHASLMTALQRIEKGIREFLTRRYNVTAQCLQFRRSSSFTKGTADEPLI